MLQVVSSFIRFIASFLNAAPVVNTPGKKWSLEDDDEEEEDDIKQKVEAARAGIMEALGETGEEVEETPVEEEDEVDPLDSFMQVSDHFIQSFGFPSIYISFHLFHYNSSNIGYW